MAPFDVIYRDVPDDRLSELLGATNAAGFATPTLTPAGGGTLVATSEFADSRRRLGDQNPFDGDPDLPHTWRVVRELDGQSYRWPEERETFDEYRVYSGET